MILGNKLTIEFRSYPHGKKRGGPGGGQIVNEDLAARWGFRLIIRPIYGEPSTIVQPSIKQDMM